VATVVLQLPASNFVFTIRCPNGINQNVTISLPSYTYVIPAQSANLFPSNPWQASMALPSSCWGRVVFGWARLSLGASPTTNAQVNLLYAVNTMNNNKTMTEELLLTC
jgi:hypothetical protein